MALSFAEELDEHRIFDEIAQAARSAKDVGSAYRLREKGEKKRAERQMGREGRREGRRMWKTASVRASLAGSAMHACSTRPTASQNRVSFPF